MFISENEVYGKYVFALYETGNMTKAAKALGISQPALSLGISSVEKKLGLTLFNRKTTPIVPTEEGRLYIAYLEKERLLWADLEREIRDLRDEKSGSVAVGGPATYIEYMLLPACGKLRREFENSEVTIREGTVFELADRVKAGTLDCFISTTDRLPEDIVTEYVRDEEIYLCVSADSPAADRLRGDPGRFSFLEGTDFIFLEESQPLQLELNRFLSEYGITVKKSCEVSQTRTALSLCDRGLGACLASESALQTSGIRERFTLYRLPSAGRKLYIACGRDRYISALCRRFMDIVKEGSD